MGAEPSAENLEQIDGYLDEAARAGGTAFAEQIGVRGVIESDLTDPVSIVAVRPRPGCGAAGDRRA